MNETNKANYEAYKAHHICVKCGREKAEPNRIKCWDCLEKDRIRHKDRRRKNQYTADGVKYTTAWSRKHRAEQKAKGLCIFCNKPISEYSTVFCVEHRIKNQRKNEMKKDGIARAERPFYGMCYRCADKVEEGQKLCARCRATSMRNLDKRTKTPQEMEHYQAWKADNAIIFAKRTI